MCFPFQHHTPRQPHFHPSDGIVGSLLPFSCPPKCDHNTGTPQANLEGACPSVSVFLGVVFLVLCFCFSGNCFPFFLFLFFSGNVFLVFCFCFSGNCFPVYFCFMFFCLGIWKTWCSFFFLPPAGTAFPTSSSSSLFRFLVIPIVWLSHMRMILAPTSPLQPCCVPSSQNYSYVIPQSSRGYFFCVRHYLITSNSFCIFFQIYIIHVHIFHTFHAFTSYIHIFIYE